MKIDFITFIGRNSADYAEYMKYHCEKLKSGKHKINWKCIESVGAEKLPKGFKCVAKSGEAGHNSLNHSLALNLAQKYVENDYVIFADADICILYKNWDDIIIQELQKYDCFGASYNDKIKYKKFPNLYLFAFRSYILDKVELDFSPKLLKSGKICKTKVNKKEAKIFGLKNGGILKCDTGWKLPKIIKPQGFKSKVLQAVSMKSKNRQLPFDNDRHKKFCLIHPTHHCEFHYNGKIFATHKQASRNHPISGIYGKSWVKRIELYRNKNG
jgi:hypothetical protein